MFVERFLRFIPKKSLKKAIAFFNKGDYRKACKEFEEYISHAGELDSGKDQELIRMYMVESYIEYSRKLDYDGDTSAAVKQLEKAIELQPKYADVHYGLGKLYEKVGNRVNSRESLKRALAINPNYFRARVMLARSYWLDGNHSRSAEELVSSLSASPAFFIEQLQDLTETVRREPSSEDINDLFRNIHIGAESRLYSKGFYVLLIAYPGIKMYRDISFGIIWPSGNKLFDAITG